MFLEGAEMAINAQTTITLQCKEKRWYKALKHFCKLLVSIGVIDGYVAIKRLCSYTDKGIMIKIGDGEWRNLEG